MKAYARIYIYIVAVWIALILALKPWYGVEEDSYTAAHTAYLAYESDTYQLSRLPGHPIFEYALRYTWSVRDIFWPFLIGIGLFVSAIFTKRVFEKYCDDKFKGILLAGLFLTPATAIALGETMEYTLALGTLTMSWYYGDSKRWFLAALLLAISAGLRLPNLVFGLPLFFMIWLGRDWKQAVAFAISSFLLTGLFYYPVWNEYGLAFFDTYDLLYPPLLKVLYKGTVGTWGILGSFGLLIAIAGLNIKNAIKWLREPSQFPYAIALAFSLGLFLFLPEKSVFLLPFTILLGATVLRFSKKAFAYIGFGLMLINPLFLGTDLVDDLRGIPESRADVVVSAGSQQMGIQLFLPNPQLKAENKVETTLFLASEIGQIQEPTLVITGWWFPFLQMHYLENENPKLPEGVEFVYYADAETIQKAISEGKSILFTPEAEVYNEQRYGHDLVSRYGNPLLKAYP
ncbi:hypothetical protein [Phaeocystidibacter luteus]|uniref:Glycosyltransferase RgtA/B/C/D-like domain-containing protein n=1 Tax=Phaeocystidibacter luteus TaxID=911197 RepID=A0A6N6RM67_9FLAO|nr:hypothetical protein [Phaeocystidibacter luteus]KAB2814663.1 hypothetical protein F8C67_02665 [Phaeocystidibacter luteus]